MGAEFSKTPLSEKRFAEEEDAALACGATDSERWRVARLTQVQRESLENEVKAHARAQCKESFEEYYRCCKESPVAMIVTCRPALANLNKCLKPHTAEVPMFRHKLDFVRSGRVDLPTEQQGLKEGRSRDKQPGTH